MSATVYTTAGGRRFHADRACRALESGRMLSDVDCGCDEFCNHRLPTTHLPRKRAAEDAARAGYTACRVCVPPALALPATGRTYGHEPWFVLLPDWRKGYGCARCRVRVRVPYMSHYDDPDDVIGWHHETRAVPWPCTSAVVLGLVVTDADRWNARYGVGTPVVAYPWTRGTEPLRTVTRTPAWRLGHGDSVVSVDGHAGGIALTYVDPL